MSKISRLEVIETGSRRRWTQDEKRRIVAESLSVPRNVSATARRYGLSSGQLFTWCRQAREDRLIEAEDGAGFVRAIVTPEEASSDTAMRVERGRSPDTTTKCGGPGRMVIVLVDGRRVMVDSGVDAAALGRVLDVLERR
jgi:transposase